MATIRELHLSHGHDDELDEDGFNTVACALLDAHHAVVPDADDDGNVSNCDACGGAAGHTGSAISHTTGYDTHSVAAWIIANPPAPVMQGVPEGFRQVYVIEADVASFAAHLGMANTPRKISVCIDGGVKIKVNENMWTLPYGTRQEG